MPELRNPRLPKLPPRWVWACLGDIAEIKLGKMLSKKAFEPGLPQLPYLRNENVRWFGIDTSDVKNMGFTDAEVEKFRLNAGDLLVCEGGEPGRAAVVTEDCTCFLYQKALHRVRPANGIVTSRFLQYFFKHFITDETVIERRSQTTIKHLPREKMVRVQVPLPPPAEQHRIVARIEELFSDLDAGVAALARVRANLKRYRASVLKAAVEGRLTEAWRKANPDTEPAARLLERILTERRKKWEAQQLASFAENKKNAPKNWKDKYKEPAPPDTTNLPELPKGWCWATVDQLAEIQGGIQKQPKRAPRKNAYPYLRVANVLRNRLDLQEMSYFELFNGELERLRLVPGDLLIVEGNGSKTEIGRSALWGGELDNCVHQNHIIRVRFLGGLPKYYNAYWNSPNGNARVMEQAASTSGLYTLSVAKVSAIGIPLPPFEEQEQIVAECERRLSVNEQNQHDIEAAVQRATRLRQSILKRAFEGKLVPQDPSDEPAESLLNRLPSNRPQGNGTIGGRKHGRQARRNNAT